MSGDVTTVHAIGRQGRRPLLAAAVSALALAAFSVTAAGGSAGELSYVSLATLVVYAVLCRALLRSSARWVSVANVFVASWLVWFPLRMLVIQMDRDDIALHPEVRTASDGELSVVWLLGALGFAAFALGVLLVRRSARLHTTRQAVPEIGRNTYMGLGVAGLGASWAQVLAGLQLGFFGQASEVYLLGIAGVAFHDARERRWSWSLVALVGATILLGTTTWFKATAIAPLIAWVLGSVLGGFRLSFLRVSSAILVALLLFAGIQGQRLTGGSNPIEGARAAAFDHDLSTGLVEEQPDLGAAISNVIGGVLNRTAGADALVVIRSRTPSVIPFQGGRTLWQPAASTLPAVQPLLDLELTTLSLGKYFKDNYWSVNPGADPSAQAMTMPGDFYVNFGVAGLVLGMFAIGLIAGRVESRFPSGTALGAAVLAYAGLPLATVDSNVAYAVGNTAIRLAVVLMLLLAFRAVTRRASPAVAIDVTGTAVLVADGRTERRRPS